MSDDSGITCWTDYGTGVATLTTHAPDIRQAAALSYAFGHPIRPVDWSLGDEGLWRVVGVRDRAGGGTDFVLCPDGAKPLDSLIGAILDPAGSARS